MTNKETITEKLCSCQGIIIISLEGWEAKKRDGWLDLEEWAATKSDG